MSNRYRYIDTHTIEMYDGGILRQFEEGKLVRVVANPTDADLAEFGYKELHTAPMPESDEHFYTPIYTDGDVITESWEEHPIEDLGTTG